MSYVCPVHRIVQRPAARGIPLQTSFFTRDGLIRPAWTIQYAQICRGFALKGPLKTAPGPVLSKKKPVALDL